MMVNANQPFFFLGGGGGGDAANPANPANREPLMSHISGEHHH